MLHTEIKPYYSVEWRKKSWYGLRECILHVFFFLFIAESFVDSNYMSTNMSLLFVRLRTKKLSNMQISRLWIHWKHQNKCREFFKKHLEIIISPEHAGWLAKLLVMSIISRNFYQFKIFQAIAIQTKLQTKALTFANKLRRKQYSKCKIAA